MSESLLELPSNPRALLVLAHGAGAGMKHPFLTAVAKGLAARSIATLRYEFPYMEAGRKRPDTPRIAHAAVRGACAEAAKRAPGIPLFAGGKSFGGRMTSQAQSVEPLPEVRGLVFLGFPLHPAGKPGTERADHLNSVKVPMLFLQGSRDELASLDLLRPVVAKLGERALLHVFEDADHSFTVPAKSARKGIDVMNELFDELAVWMSARC